MIDAKLLAASRSVLCYWLITIVEILAGRLRLPSFPNWPCSKCGRCRALWGTEKRRRTRSWFFRWHAVGAELQGSRHENRPWRNEKVSFFITSWNALRVQTWRLATADSSSLAILKWQTKHSSPRVELLIWLPRAMVAGKSNVVRVILRV